MRKSIELLIVLSLVLSACTLPSSSTPVPTADLISTQVVVQLTEQAPPTLPPTVAPKATETRPPTAAATATSAPAFTATPSVPALTATTAPAATQKASPTPAPSDPLAKLVATKPVWRDTFQDGKGWGLEGNPYDDDNTRVEVKNNALVLTSYGAAGWHGWRLSYRTPQDFYLEATLKTGDCATSDFYGLMFRSDGSAGYWFGVTCDGRFNLRTGDVNNFEDVADFAKSDLIQAGSNKTNRLGVWIKGSKITLYANGKLLGDYTDTTYSAAGKFGFFIARQKTASFVVSCSEVAYWNLP